MNWPEPDKCEITRYLGNLSGRILIGVDGFVDEVWQIIESRKSRDEYLLYNGMKEFIDFLSARGKGGVACEVVRKRRCYGGFTANTGKAVSSMGVGTSMLGMYGKRGTDDVFEEFKKNCALFSIGDPAVCQIYEFEDGKIMLPYIKELLDVNWDSLVASVGYPALKALFSEADIVALGYWSNMPAFDEIISQIIENFLTGSNISRIFFDFADIKKRNAAALGETLKTLKRVNAKVPVTISLNENEAGMIASSQNLNFSEKIELAEKSVENLQNKLGIDEIIMHTPDFAAAATALEGVSLMPQNRCEKPVKTAGAGDTFNGGYLAASLGRLSIRERLAIANAATEFYVRNGYAPSRSDVLDAFLIV